LNDSPEGQKLIQESEELLQLSKNAFAAHNLEEKNKFHLKKGVSMFGYKAAGTVKSTDPHLRPDTTEFFNISKDHMHGIAPTRDYPSSIEEARPLLKEFTKDAHETGMTVLRTLARALGLREDIFTEGNRFEKPAGDHCRLTHKSPHSTDANAIGLPSHTDFGTITILFTWLGGLQIQKSPTASSNGASDGTNGTNGEKKEKSEWVFVKPLPGTAIINLGDAMVKFTNGALKSAKHRVVPSPGEQGEEERYSVVYFVRPCNDTLMKPVGDFENGTHVKVGGKISVGEEEGKVYTAGEWMIKRAIQLGS